MTATNPTCESTAAERITAPADRIRQSRAPTGGASGRAASKRSRRRGIAAVEFAVLAPFMTIVVLGTFELARGIMVKQVLNDAARRGCRIGIQPLKANSDVTSGINNILTDNGFSTSIANITIQVNGVTVDCSTAKQNDRVSVKVSIP
ncbi:MAG TPA: TadE/TadG family type IV pilus assembly protein, partial [Pirellulales bacterium]|nr:TadE/TadG family type IV pilus assembly protein [Pirellulales bacterium]